MFGVVLVGGTLPRSLAGWSPLWGWLVGDTLLGPEGVGRFGGLLALAGSSLLLLCWWGVGGGGCRVVFENWIVVAKRCMFFLCVILVSVVCVRSMWSSY